MVCWPFYRKALPLQSVVVQGAWRKYYHNCKVVPALVTVGLTLRGSQSRPVLLLAGSPLFRAASCKPSHTGSQVLCKRQLWAGTPQGAVACCLAPRPAADSFAAQLHPLTPAQHDPHPCTPPSQGCGECLIPVTHQSHRAPYNEPREEHTMQEAAAPPSVTQLNDASGPIH